MLTTRKKLCTTPSLLCKKRSPTFLPKWEKLLSLDGLLNPLTPGVFPEKLISKTFLTFRGLESAEIASNQSKWPWKCRTQQALQWANSQSSKSENNTYVETSWRWQRFENNLCKQGLVVNFEPVMLSCIKPIGHKIDYNGVGVLRGKYPPPPMGSPKVGHEWLASPW